MIGTLLGVVVEVQPESVLLDVGGVGYEVHCHSRTVAALQAADGATRVFTDLQLRNDLLRLYGFPDARERDWFRLLCGVHHVGAKGAMAILGTLGVEAFADAVAIGDSASVQRAPGIGKRTAERVVLELKGKVPALGAVRMPSGEAGVQQDAVLALTGLGYPAEMSLTAVRETMAEAPGSALEEVIREALRRLGRQHAGP